MYHKRFIYYNIDWRGWKDLYTVKVNNYYITQRIKIEDFIIFCNYQTFHKSILDFW